MNSPSENPKRTSRQNRAMHLWFRHFSEALNDAGLDQRKVLKPGVNIPWTEGSFKDQIWRPVQEAMYKKKSTTELTTKELTKVEEVITREMGEKFGMQVDFPSIETMIRRNYDPTE